MKREDKAKLVSRLMAFHQEWYEFADKADDKKCSECGAPCQGKAGYDYWIDVDFYVTIRCKLCMVKKSPGFAKRIEADEDRWSNKWA